MVAKLGAKALIREIIEAGEERKAENTVVIDVREKTGFTDYFVIFSGNSQRQVTAIVDNILERLKKHKIKPLGVEGYEVGAWALIDFGWVVVHIFQPEARSYYDIEGFWADAERVDVAKLGRRKKRAL
ncbi:MAG: ribosome silencing factor [Myxococcota bacterium]